MRLKDKVAIITGAAGNIGLATARLFAREGARLVLIDAQRAALDAACKEFDSVTMLPITADVTSAEDTIRVADATIARFGGIDILFANAGIEGLVQPTGDYPEEVYDKVMDVNVKGVFLGVKHIAPRMREGGSLVMTSSIMGLMGAPRNIAYTASKHAVVGLMRSAAADLAARRIRVNTVHPGMVESDMLRRLIERHPDPKQRHADLIARIKLGRFVAPEEIAHTVLFLSSDESCMTTGQTFLVDGGYLE
ncbi:SDR family NAD(P)-dependent oxidoreductase [Variovorax terrae]|uniref:SDR family oxidoreductase n=1 Tax=Variovorax terrae TaxID=2923278 RepID=A0A9X1W3A1_9BURK|nr:SDR family oxidoreductase [Variovorax terrae]MCJ0765113.1 SDR family oxidoreductase [Variovorax terrae]